jgi:hypothetical protein
MRYAVVIEKADGNYSAYVPDLPGCVATGETVTKPKSGTQSASTSTASKPMACRSPRQPASRSTSRRSL